MTMMMIALIMFGTKIFTHHIFEQYVHKKEADKMKAFIDLLQQKYDIHHSWDFILKTPSIWYQLLNQININEQVTPEPPFLNFHQNDPVHHFHPRVPMPFSIGSGISLHDKNKEYIIGNHLTGNKRFIKITMDNKTVGWIGLMKPNHFKKPEEKFLFDLQLIFILSAIGIIIIVAIVSFFFAKHILKPIQSLILQDQKK
jgi:two-component system sensor histidine kinase BaeS